MNFIMKKFKFINIGLSAKEEEEIAKLLSLSPHNPPQLEDIWTMMDQVWDNYGCDNKKTDWDKIDKFYSHPVWILNGLFIEQDDLSMQHRHSISDWIILNKKQNDLQKIVDYGGGFGTLAKLIAKKDSSIRIDIFEPHPSEFNQKSLTEFPNIRFVNCQNKTYDCLVSTDVLEHVPDALRTFSEMINSVRLNGYLIIANNFYPVIKCHLPNSFHLRYTFKIFAHMMGLKNIGACHGSHAVIYKKVFDTLPNLGRLRIAEKVSRFSFPFLKTIHLRYRFLKNKLTFHENTAHQLF